jgi:hypothetical protein
MTDLIELTKRRLNDPILMSWALDRYRDAEMGEPRCRQTMERAWFDELTLCRWLGSDDQDILTRLQVIFRGATAKPGRKRPLILSQRQGVLTMLPSQTPIPRSR